MNVEGGFSLVALFDGTTLNAVLDVEGAPLLQFYTEGTNNYTPDFEKLPENEKPTVKLIMRNISTGKVLTPKPGNVINWKYNDVVLEFGEGGLCTSEGMAGIFKKIDQHPTAIDGDTYKVPALRVMKNLVPISGVDNDRISVGGTIEVNGQNIPFKEIGTMVQIRKAATNAHLVYISDDNAGTISTQHPNLKVTATLYKDTSKVTDLEGYTFQWYKLLGTEDAKFKQGATITITKADVDNILKLRCDVSYKGKLLASGFHQVTDITDPYYVDFKIEGDGVVGNQLRSGQTATVTPVIRQRHPDGQTSEVIEGTTWNWSLKDNEGKPFTLAPHEAATFEAQNIQVTYSVLLNQAKGGMTGSVSANVD